MNKPFRAIALAVVCCTVGVLTGAVVANAVTGTSEVDRANANTPNLLQGNIKKFGCNGEDSVAYVTYKGGFKGTQNQILPDPTDYTLSGSLAVSGVKWTINTATSRGVLTAAVTLTNASSNAPEYAGKLTLVTQGIPAAGATVPGRGWIVANFKVADDSVAPPNDDNLVANVEAVLTPTSMDLEFGDLANNPGFPDYAAVTNVAPTAADGTC